MPPETEEIIRGIYRLADDRDIRPFQKTGMMISLSPFPVYPVFASAHICSAAPWPPVIRIITFRLPDPDTLHIPAKILSLAELPKGLVLVTGPAGSGKSTLLPV